MGGIVHETNTSSTLHTRLADFSRDDQLLTGHEAVEYHAQVRNPWGAFIHVGRKEGIEVRSSLTAMAAPSGLICKEDYRNLRQRLLDGISAHLPAHGILLWLHGAMVAQDFPDADGDLLQAIRALVGSNTPIIAVLDYHGNISDEMIDHSTALVGYNTYPHVDEYESGLEAARIMLLTNRRQVHPVQALAKPPIIAPGVFARSGDSPMQSMHRQIAQWKQDNKIINGSAFGGFPYADVYEAGLSLVIVTDNDRPLAHQLAGELCNYAWQQRQSFARRLPPPAEAVTKALAAPSPVLLADVADNPGAGASGDSAAILKALLERGVSKAAIGTICDQEAVFACHAQGIGKTIRLDIGGKTDPYHGPPLPVEGYIRLLSDGRYVGEGPMRKGRLARMGKTAVLEVGDISVLLTERRVQATDPQVFRSQGIEPLHQRVLVVKSTVHYRAAFEPLVQTIIEVHGPGLADPNLQNTTYKCLRRPIFPLDPI